MHNGANHSPGHDLPTLGELGGDLLDVTPLQLIWTLAVPFVAMGGYALFAWWRIWPLAVASVMMLSFVTYGSTSHDLVHRTLGLPRRLNDFLLSLIELLSLRSGTAYRLSHLNHHRLLLADGDIEGETAHGSLLRAVSSGPTLQVRLLLWAWRTCEPMRPRLLLEAVGIVLLIAMAIFALRFGPGPLVYVVLVVGGSWLFPLITVYIPHDGRAKEPLAQTRLFRARFVQLIAFEHLYHLEHHLYPAVPHHQWKELARRLDPHFARAGVKPYRWLRGGAAEGETSRGGS
jgi:beta-carotene hydroxylase